ncbi:MAG: translation initiation factor 2 [Desulfovibrio sp.]|nr:translation initiation factor 2 [Desulfovibrio sp.]
MRNFLFLILLIFALVTGCVSSGANDAPALDSVAAKPVPAPETPKTAPNGKGKKIKAPKAAKTSAKTEVEIRAALEVAAHKLTAQAARTVMPHKSSKEVKMEGKEYVAAYIEVDIANVTMEMRHGTNVGHYVGAIQYQENIYECRGPNKNAALSAPCKQVGKRNITELINFDGNVWQF